MPLRFFTAAVVLFVALPLRAADRPSAAGIDFFEKKIRPALVEHCYACHSAEAVQAKKLKGNLRLDTREGLRQGGDSGPVVVPGNAKKSLLLAALRHEGDAPRMPPKSKLAEAVIADFAKWIEIGAAPSP